MMPVTYKDSDVDIKREARVVSAISDWVKKTSVFQKVLGSIGHYSGLIDIGGGNALAISTDGVGSKVLVCQLADNYSKIGIDLVGMLANDVIAVGATPIAMVDYIAAEKPSPELLGEVGKGLYEGAKQASIAILGGETATLPDIIKGVKPGKGFDLAGTCIGIVNKDKITTGEKIVAGDCIIGLESSGIHSNGLTLARKVLGLNDKKILSELLVPTRIYVQEALEIIRNHEVHGLAHITGGGFLNLQRLKENVCFNITDLPELKWIFKEIREKGKVSDQEMFRTFNCNIGFCVITPESECKKVVKTSENHGTKAYRIGEIIEGKGVTILGKNI